jgi:zinc protease
MRQTLIAFVFGLILAPSALSAAVFSPVTETLANGMQIIVVENHRAPVVTHMIWIKAGAADDPYGKSGLAHYLEHLLFKATKKRPAGSYSKAIAGVGGTENAFTSYDYTAYFATVAKENLSLVMELESDRMANLLIEAKEATPELAVVVEEKRQRVDSDPYAPFSQQVNAALHPHHPYGRPTIGWQQEIEKLTVADANAFYRQWYRPDNAVLVVSGDVKPTEVFALAKKFYGGWKGEKTSPRQRVEDPDFKGNVRIEKTEDRVHEKFVYITLKAPSRRQDNVMSYALELLTQMLAGSDGDYLPKTLVQDLKLAGSVGLGYDADAYDGSSLTLSAVPKDGVMPDQLIAAIRKALADYQAKPVDEKTMADAKKALQRSAILARDSVMGPAYAFGMALATGQKIEDVEAWPDSIAAVTPEQIQKAIGLIVESASVTGVMLPGKEKPVAEKTAPETPSLPLQQGPMQ